MNIIHSHLLPTGSQESGETRDPKKALVNIVNTLQRGDSQVEADFHPETGSVRIISTTSNQGLGDTRFRNDPKGHATRTIRKANIAKLLELADCDLAAPVAVEFPWGYRVEFNQVHHVRGRRTAVPVRAGYVHVSMDKKGRIFQISTTLRHADKPQTLGKVVTRAQAIDNAKAKLAEVLATAELAKEEAQKRSPLGDKLDGIKLNLAIAGIDPASLQDNGRLTQLISEQRPIVNKSQPKVQLVLSAHDDKMDPMYEVSLSVGEPRTYWAFLVHAKTGEVVHNHNLLHFAAASNAGSKARVLMRVPNPDKVVNDQARDAIIAGLPDPKVLKNKYLQVFMGGSKKEVKAKADGTFNYKEGDPEFAAVCVFFGIMKQFEVMLELGMKEPDICIPVYVHDPAVRDNAYFDPENPQLRMGVGSGLKRGGLAVVISFDLGVSWHECGHYIVYIQTPGKDLPGGEGGAMHESTGDVLGNLLMNYLFRLWFAKELGETFGLKELKADRRVIGEYALPPDGIRIQRNSKKTPGDKTGEVHDDGLISGGAHGDMLEALCSKEGADLETELKNFGRIYLMALSLVPAHKVTFRDMLRCLITADQNLNGGTNRKLIEDAHAAHGIKLQGATGGNTVVIVTSTPRRRRRKTA